MRRGRVRWIVAPVFDPKTGAPGAGINNWATETGGNWKTETGGVWKTEA